MAAKKKKSIILRVLLLIFAGYMIFQLGSLQVEMISLKKEYKAEQAKVEKLNLEIDELKHLLDKGSEADIIEKAARERLGYVFSDEQVFIDISGN